MKDPNQNISVTVTIKVVQGDGFYEANTLAEATSSIKATLAPEEIRPMVDFHVNSAASNAHARLAMAIASRLEEQGRRAVEKAERESRPDLA